MKTSVTYSLKKGLFFLGVMALPFAFFGCGKEKTTPDNPSNTDNSSQVQKHNVELVYGSNPEIQWQNISMDTLYKYNIDQSVDTIFMIPETPNQFSTFSPNQLKNYFVPLLRERHNVNPNKIFGKGDLVLKATSVQDNPEIVRFFADTLRYHVITR